MTFNHLNKLEKIRSNKGIKFLSPAISPGNHCPMRVATVMAENIKGLSSLLIGMEECTIHSRLFSPEPNGLDGELRWLYLMDSSEVVFGAREGIIEAIKEMDKEGAKAILLIATCIPELIGEDLEGIVYEIQDEISCPITYVMLGQFKHISYPPGFWKTMEAMTEFMTYEDYKLNEINILGRSPEEDHVPLANLFHVLNKNGINTHAIGPKSSLYDFQLGAKRSLNIVVSPYTFPLAISMKEKFDIPYVDLHNYYSVAEIDQSFEKIKSMYSIDLLDHLREQREEALYLEEKIKKLVKGLTFVLALRIDLPLQLTSYFIQLGMKPLLIHIEEFYNSDKIFIKDIKETGHNPYVCKIGNEDSDLELIKELKPDLYFGYLPNDTKGLRCVKDMFDFYGYVAYERTIKLLKRILNNLEEVKNGTA